MAPPSDEHPSGPERRPAGSAASDTVKYARLSSLTGMLFAVLFVVAFVLVHTTPTLSASDAEITAYYASSSTLLVTVGLYLIPFAGIAFLWHAHCPVADRRPGRRHRPPSPMGCSWCRAILFVVLLFAGTASAGAVALLKDLTTAPLPSA